MGRPLYTLYYLKVTQKPLIKKEEWNSPMNLTKKERKKVNEEGLTPLLALV